jgi:PST family polysaccharide transporter
LTVPGYIGLALVAAEAIVVIFGAKWAPSATAASLLFLIGPALSLQAFSGAIWNSVGKPSVTLRFRILNTVLNVAGFIIAVFWFGTIEAVAAAFAVRSYVLLPLNLYWMQKHAAVPVRAQLRQWRGVALATAGMSAAVLATKFALLPVLETWALLLAEITVGVVVYGGLMLVLERSLVRELIGVGFQVLPASERLARRLGLRRDPHHLPPLVDDSVRDGSDQLVADPVLDEPERL